VCSSTRKVHLGAVASRARERRRLVTVGATTGFDTVTDLRHVFYRQLSVLGSTMGSKSELFQCCASSRRGGSTRCSTGSCRSPRRRKARSCSPGASSSGKVVLFRRRERPVTPSPGRAPRCRGRVQAPARRLLHTRNVPGVRALPRPAPRCRRTPPGCRRGRDGAQRLAGGSERAARLGAIRREPPFQRPPGPSPNRHVAPGDGPTPLVLPGVGGRRRWSTPVTEAARPESVGSSAAWDRPGRS